MAYPKNVTQRARAILNQRKQKAEAIKASRLQNVYEHIPSIKQIDLKLSQTGAGVVKSVLQNPDRCEQIIESLKMENLRLQQEKAMLLISAGLGANYLETPYFCSECSDTGYVRNKKCSCFERLLRQCAYESFNNIPTLKDYGFESFNLDYYPKTAMSDTGIVPYDNAKRIKDFCLDYTSNFDEHSKSVLFMGGTGLGKTHLSLAIARNVIESGYGVMYNSVQNLLNKIEKERFSRDFSDKNPSDTLEMANECDLLVIDDLGSEHNTTFTRSVVYNIINSRLISQKPTIISTNLDLAELKNLYTERIISRLVGEYTVFKFYGNDIRIQKKY